MISDRKISHLRRFLVSNIGLSVPSDYTGLYDTSDKYLKKSSKVATKIASSIKNSGGSAPKK